MSKTHIIQALITFVFSFSFFVDSSYAQEALTLKDAINYALKNKNEAINAAWDIKNANYQIQEARSKVLPSLNGAGALTYNAKLQQMALDFNGQTQVLKMGTEWQSNAAIQLEQQIFNLAAFTGLKAAKTTREFYQLNATLTEEQIIERVADSYYDIFKTREQIKTLEKTIENNTKLKEVMQGLESDGLAKEIDVDRITVAVNNLNSNKTVLLNALKLQENGLKYLIGMDIHQPIALSEEEFKIQTLIQDEGDYDINNRNEIKLMEMQSKLLELNKSAVKTSAYPTLGVSANYGYMNMGDQFPYFVGENQGVYGSDFSAITLNLTVPIFNGFMVRSKVKQLEIEILKQEEDLKDIKLALNLEIENANTQMRNAILTLETQQSNKELAEKVLKSIENNYKNGLASLTDLIDAENSFAEAQNNYTAAVMGYKSAEIQLKKAKGELKSYYLE